MAQAMMLNEKKTIIKLTETHMMNFIYFPLVRCNQLPSKSKYYKHDVMIQYKKEVAEEIVIDTFITADCNWCVLIL